MDSSTADLNLTTLQPPSWNGSHHVPFIYFSTLGILENHSLDEQEERTMKYINLQPLEHPPPSSAIALAVLLVFLFAPTIIIGNSLILVAIYRFKRLRTPSNYLVMSLATSDLGVGVYLPIGMYLEVVSLFPSTQNTSFIPPDHLTSDNTHILCLLNYCVSITLCCVSVLVMVAIAVDRFTSLARPLRYNNLITHTAMERYIAVFWVYALLVGVTPLGYHALYGDANKDNTIFIYKSMHCSFGNLISRPMQLFMFCAVYGPSACILVACYVYIYVVARGHARAISEVRHSLQYAHGSNAPRYGLALATTTGMFLGLWMPFQICMLLDVFTGTSILNDWFVIYLALPIISSSAFNPWIYGYRNAELRLAVHKVVDDLLTLLGLNYRSHPIGATHVVPPSVAATAGDNGSLINPAPQRTPNHKSIKRECYSWNPDDDFLLVPIAKPESSGFLSMEDELRNIHQIHHQLNLSYRSLNNNVYNTKTFIRKIHFPRIISDKKRSSTNSLNLNQLPNSNISCKHAGHAVIDPAASRKDVGQQGRSYPGLKGSRSMIETFAGIRNVANPQDVWIYQGKNLMMNGASIV